MFKKVFILYVLILGFNSKAQNWAPLDTGINLNPSINYPYGLMADNIRGNLFAFGTQYPNGSNPAAGMTVWNKTKWEIWYPNRSFDWSRRTIFQNKILVFNPFYLNNDNTKPRVAVLRFTNKTDIDTLKVLSNHEDYAPTTCVYNGKLILINGIYWNLSGLKTIATFDGDTVIPIGDPNIAYASISRACVYKGELYASGWLDCVNSVRGVMKLTSTGWQKIYEIQGGLSFINDMIVYNDRLYIYGGIYKAENQANLGNSILAYDGQKFDTLDGGIVNTLNLTNGNIYDAAVCHNRLYVTGEFDLAGGVKTKGIAYWNDTTWCGIYKDLDSVGNFFRVECFDDTIYQVAEFYKIYNNYRYGMVAKLNNMSLADTCSKARYNRTVRYSYDNLLCLPNPFIDNITLQIPSEYILTETKIIITSNLGQKLMDVSPSNVKEVLNLSFLSSGMYFLTVEDNRNKKTVKIIKQ